MADPHRKADDPGFGPRIDACRDAEICPGEGRFKGVGEPRPSFAISAVEADAEYGMGCGNSRDHGKPKASVRAVPQSDPGGTPGRRCRPIGRIRPEQTIRNQERTAKTDSFR